MQKSILEIHIDPFAKAFNQEIETIGEPWFEVAQTSYCQLG